MAVLGCLGALVGLVFAALLLGVVFVADPMLATVVVGGFVVLCWPWSWTVPRERR